MRKFLMTRSIRKAAEGRLDKLENADVKAARSVLFAVFSRYGDAIISLKVVREFMERFPDKRYFIATSNQLEPYAEKIAGRRATIMALDKRKNPIKLIKVTKALKDADIDLGLNPFSLGEDSEYFASLAKRHYFFKGSRDFGVEENLYECVRRYLNMPEKKASGADKRRGDWAKEIKDVKKIVIAPDSSNVVKSLNPADLRKLVRWLKGRFPKALAIVALAKDDPSLEHEGVSRFIFKKSVDGSRKFLELVESADIVAAVDAGPLHLADALGKPVIGIFGPTAPETIMDKDSSVIAFRAGELDGAYCFVQACKDPVCIHALFDAGGADIPVAIDFSRKIIVEEAECCMTTGTGHGK